MKFGLIGGSAIAKYTIADYLWREIARVQGIRLGFHVVPIESFHDLCRFYWQYLEDEDFIGFNVALPWKESITKLVDKNDFISEECPYVNTVYKKEGVIRTVNTDVIGVERALSRRLDLKEREVLILGGGGAGFSTAAYLSKKYGCLTYIFDIQKVRSIKGVKTVQSYAALMSRKYDIVINASPVGKYYLDNPPVQFSSPLNIDMFQKIIKPGTVVMDMNYLPVSTQMLKIGLIHHLPTVSGTEMLVHQALASFWYYTGGEVSEANASGLVDSVNSYSKAKEDDLYKRPVVNSQ